MELSTRVEGALTQVAASVTLLASNARQLDGSTSNVGGISRAVAGLLEHINSLQTVVADIHSGLAALPATAQAVDQVLTATARTFATAVSTSTDRVEEDLRRSNTAVGLLTDRLATVAQTIIDRTRQQQGLQS